MSDNRELIGRWIWAESRNDISESGNLTLYDDLSFSHRLVFSNPTEKIVEQTERNVFRWSVNGTALCFSRGDLDPPDCWRFSVISENGEKKISYNASVFDEAIVAHKVKLPD